MQDAPLYLVLLVLAFAAARIAVLLVHDTILDAPRDWLHRHFPPLDDPIRGLDYQQRDKAGVHIKDGELRRGSMLGELFTCTRCLSVWTTALVAGVWISGVPYAQEAVALVAVMGLANLIAKKG